MKQTKTPDRKKQYYLREGAIAVFVILFSVYFARIKWADEVLFGFIILSALVYLFRNLRKKPDELHFRFATQYDNFSKVLSIVFGLSLIIFAASSNYFESYTSLGRINFLIVGVFVTISGFRRNDSLKFLLSSTELIEVENYNFSIKPQTKVITLSPHTIIITSEDDENYIFEELNITQEVSDEFSQWIHRHMQDADIKVSWKGAQ